MLYQRLAFQKKDHIIVINIFEHENKKIMPDLLPYELNELCAEIAWDEEIRVVILTGSDEKSFSLEIDLVGAVPGGNEEQPIKFYALAEQISKLDRPVIAAINGDAVGLGLELALACDIRIASEKSHFGLSHIKSGFIPWDGGTQRLSRLVGTGKALEMILTGEAIDAQEALRIGLVNKVISPKELTTMVMDMAREMAAKGPIALRYAKEAIHKGMDLTLEQGLRLEADLYFLLHTTRDRTEGIQAFREKRPVRFEGK